MCRELYKIPYRDPILSDDRVQRTISGTDILVERCLRLVDDGRLRKGPAFELVAARVLNQYLDRLFKADLSIRVEGRAGDYQDRLDADFSVKLTEWELQVARTKLDRDMIVEIGKKERELRGYPNRMPAEVASSATAAKEFQSAYVNRGRNSTRSFMGLLQTCGAVCPNPSDWAEFGKRFRIASNFSPLILSSWNYTTNDEKRERLRDQLDSLTDRPILKLAALEWLDRLSLRDWHFE